MNDAIPWESVADLYDAYVQTTLDVPFFLDATRDVQGEVLELMSGTGRVSLPLIEAGVRLTCVDYSAEMLKRLEEKLAARNLHADLFVQDARALDLGKTFELIFIPFHAFAEITAPDDQRAALERICQHLAPDGQFICTLHNPRVRRRTIDVQLRLMGDYALPKSQRLLVWMQQAYLQDERVASIHQFYETFDARGVMTQRRMVKIRFALIEHDEFLALARATGFETCVLYGNYDKTPFDAGTSPFMLWMLKKAN
ncbi:MAG: class I SAM-dependent methyltransferase [Chloroflexi bacterium]|nr:class I SAM-dependent methyltransferase [Chloroflexota bacterium]